MKVIKGIAICFGVALAGVLVLGAVLAERSMHVRRGNTPSRSDAAQVTAIDGAMLRGVFSGSGDQGCVFLLHGIGDTHLGMSGFSEVLVAAGYRTLAPDSRAHGWSGGSLVTYGLFESRDVSSWVDWLQSQRCTGIYGLGESLGGSVLLQAIDRLDRALPFPRWIDNVVTAPATAGGVLYARIRYGLDLEATSAVEALRHTRTPVLLIDGLNDTLTPIAHSRRLARANARIQLWEVAGADHCGAFGTEPIEFQRRVLAWFNKAAPPPFGTLRRAPLPSVQ